MTTLLKFRVLLYCFCFVITCHGAIWKTEDAYIIDDQPEEDNEITVTENTNLCMDSKGVQGQCVPLEECNGLYKFFNSEKGSAENSVEIFEGLQQYLNGTDLEPCALSNATDAENSVPRVCCTSLKYANVRSTTLDEYNARYPDTETDPEPIPTVPIVPLDPLIVSGTVAGRNEFPFAVAILRNGGQQFCGGSLIDSQWVLSAAHCFDRFNSAAVRGLIIKVGDHDITKTSDGAHQDLRVAKLFLHPGFFRQQSFFRDDVALIKLKTPVSPASNIRTVPLHTGSPNINGGFVTAVVCGWGQTCNKVCRTSSVLRKTEVRIVSNSQCSQKYGGTQAPPITQHMVCAGGISGPDACNGDSGGPLVVYSGGQAYQIGIVSWGIGCGQYPGVYTRVSSFTNWITRHKQKGSSLKE